MLFAAEGPALEFLRKHQAELPTLLIVSQVGVSQTASPLAQPLGLSGEAWRGSKVYAEVKEALGKKCPRCWTYDVVVGQTSDVCSKCTEALRESAD